MNCECGETLVEAIGDETVRMSNGTEILFRRRNDYVICPRCLSIFPVDHLRMEEALTERSTQRATEAKEALLRNLKRRGN